jgi:hypothetical protein
MTKLRFIKQWAQHKPGDVMETASKTTAHWLVDVYKVAVIDRQAQPAIRAFSAPPENKMVQTPRRKKSQY